MLDLPVQSTFFTQLSSSDEDTSEEKRDLLSPIFEVSSDAEKLSTRHSILTQNSLKSSINQQNSTSTIQTTHSTIQTVYINSSSQHLNCDIENFSILNEEVRSFTAKPDTKPVKFVIQWLYQGSASNLERYAELKPEIDVLPGSGERSEGISICKLNLSLKIENVDFRDSLGCFLAKFSLSDETFCSNEASLSVLQPPEILEEPEDVVKASYFSEVSFVCRYKEVNVSQVNWNHNTNVILPRGERNPANRHLVYTRV